MVYLAALLGLLVGSFLNVCIYRIPRGESVLAPPSHCPECGERIKWFDLIPVSSRLFLRGRCRACGAEISLRYTAVEILNALLWVAVYQSFGATVAAGFYAVFISALIVAAFIDARHLIIPDGVNFFILLLGLVFSIISFDIHIFIAAVIGFFAVSSLLFIISALSGGGIGGGDIKLAAACGAFLGWRLSLAAWGFSIVLSGAYAALLLAAKKKKKGDAVPLGPFLAAGAAASVFFGGAAINWYLNFFR